MIAIIIIAIAIITVIVIAVHVPFIPPRAIIVHVPAARVIGIVSAVTSQFGLTPHVACPVAILLITRDESIYLMKDFYRIIGNGIDDV